MKTHDKLITLRLPISLYDEIAKCATLCDCTSISQYIRNLLVEDVNRNRPDNSCD